MEVRLKFALATRFLAKASSLIEIGFRKAPTRYSTEMNCAVQYTLANAITGELPNYYIDYPKVVLNYGDGDSDDARQASISVSARCIVNIAWQLYPYPRKESATCDQLMIFLYCEKTDQGIVVERTAKRDSLKLALQLQTAFSGYKFHIWMFFMSENAKHVSHTQYMGEVTLIN